MSIEVEGIGSEKKTASKFGYHSVIEKFTIPDPLVIEQASGVLTAEYTASLVPDESVVVDLTAGLGINTIYFSKRCKRVFAIEKDVLRAEALIKNLKICNVSNVCVINDDCLDWLKNSRQSCDILYLDPSRRDSSGRKLVDLKDCSPNVFDIIPLIHSRCKRLLLKASPLLDLTKAKRELPQIERFHILEVKNEIKELILDLDLSGNLPLYCSVTCHILTPEANNVITEFKLNSFPKNEFPRYLKFSEQLKIGGYVYEPSPSIMKVGAFYPFSERFRNLHKFSINTHLFYSEELYGDFPGKVFRITHTSKDFKLKGLRNGAFNVICRNHPAKANELEARYHFKGSASRFLIACTILKEKTMFLAERL